MSTLQDYFGFTEIEAMQGGMRLVLCWSVWGSFFFTLAAFFATREARLAVNQDKPSGRLTDLDSVQERESESGRATTRSTIVSKVSQNIQYGTGALHPAHSTDYPLHVLTLYP
jgi:hypothetical protein